jgi:hypothetical protein
MGGGKRERERERRRRRRRVKEEEWRGGRGQKRWECVIFNGIGDL